MIDVAYPYYHDKIIQYTLYYEEVEIFRMTFLFQFTLYLRYICTSEVRCMKVILHSVKGLAPWRLVLWGDLRQGF